MFNGFILKSFCSMVLFSSFLFSEFVPGTKCFTTLFSRPVVQLLCFMTLFSFLKSFCSMTLFSNPFLSWIYFKYLCKLKTYKRFEGTPSYQYYYCSINSPDSKFLFVSTVFILSPLKPSLVFNIYYYTPIIVEVNRGKSLVSTALVLKGL